MEGRALRFEACLNVRDLGGIQTQAGPTRSKAIIRADTLCRLNAAGQAALLDYGVRTVIDLRGHEEIGKDPNPFGRHSEIRYRHLPLQSEVTIALMPRVETGEVADRLIVDLSRLYVRRVFKAIAAAPEGGVLFHCAAGKDRTGIVALLLLAVVGASREAIVEDYMLSNEALSRFYDTWLAEAHPLDRDRVRSLIVCRPERPLALLEHFDRHYGGAEAYLGAAEVTPDEITQVRRRLLARADDRLS